MHNTMPTRPRHIVQRLLEAVSSRLQPEFPRLLARYDQALASGAHAQADVAIAAELLEGRQVLPRGKHRLFAAKWDAAKAGDKPDPNAARKIIESLARLELGSDRLRVKAERRSRQRA